MRRVRIVLGVKPIEDVSALFGTWPGDINDGFEQFVQELRRDNKTKKGGIYEKKRNNTYRETSIA